MSLKMGLFRISRELQFRVCNHGKPQASLPTARKGEHFYREEKEAGRVITNKARGFHWLSLCQERKGAVLLPAGFSSPHRMNPPLTDLPTLIKVSIY